MRCPLICALAAFVAAGAVSTATFSVDGVSSRSTTSVATIEPRTGAPGYSWLRIYFYAAPLSASDLASGTHGRVGSIKARWSAVLQLTVDRSATVWQIDLALPGHTCTVAESDRDAKSALQEFRFDGTNLKLRSQGTHVCDLAFMKIPNQTYTWNVDLDSPVVEAASPAR